MSEPPAPQLQQTDDGQPSRLSAVPWTIPDALYVLLLSTVAIYIIGGLILASVQGVLEPSQSEALALPLTSLILVGITTGYVRLRYKGATGLLFGTASPSWRAAGYGVAGGLAAVGVIALGLGTLLDLIVRSMGERLPEVQETFRQLAGNDEVAPALVLGAVAVAPVAEELLYRGMLFTAFRRRLALWPALGLSGLVFGMSHWETTLEGSLLVLLIVVPLGMFLAWLYERTGTLLVPILAHATFNLIQVIVLITQES